MTNWIRKNIGLITSFMGFFLLVIILYGDILEIFSEEYWINVYKRLTSYTTLSFCLTFLQYTIKQGISEQALSVGLNKPTTAEKFSEHKNIIKRNKNKEVYLPYFLRIRNNRETIMRKKEFLEKNSFKNEKMLRLSKNKKLIKKYDRIRTSVTVNSIKWSTTEIVYDKYGRIVTLSTYRAKRAVKGLITSAFGMIITALIVGGMFFKETKVLWWEATIQLIVIVVIMFLFSIFDIYKNYEKGAFSVPNELDEINGIWLEFEEWTVPDRVKDEVELEEKNNDEELEQNMQELIVEKNEIFEKEKECEEDADENREEVEEVTTDAEADI